jgi:hypothetical protein
MSLENEDFAAPAASSDFIRDIVAAHVAEQKYPRIHTRFPPGPNGYLHIGHAKSNCLNFGIARKRGHPLGRKSSGKKVFAPVFCFFENSGVSLLPEPSVLRGLSSLCFRLMNSVRYPSAGLCLRRGGSFSHPSGSSAGGPVKAGHSSKKGSVNGIGIFILTCSQAVAISVHQPTVFGRSKSKSNFAFPFPCLLFHLSV